MFTATAPKFTEAHKDTQIALLAMALAGTIESLISDRELNNEQAQKLVQATIEKIGLTENEFKKLLNQISPEVSEEIETLATFDIDEMKHELRAIEINREWENICSEFADWPTPKLLEKLIADGDVVSHALPESRGAMLRIIIAKRNA